KRLYGDLTRLGGNTMIKKTGVFSFLMIYILFMIAGCETQAKTYEVYFADQSGELQEALIPSQRVLNENETEITGLIRILLNESTLIPKDVTLLSQKLENGILTLNFSGNYGGLSGIDLTLADYSIAMTLCQLPQIEGVIILVEGEEISYRDRQILRMDDVVLSAYQSEPTKKTVTLYFPKKDQSGLQKEEREVLLTDEQTLTMTVLTELAKGSENQGLGVTSKSEIVSAEVRDKVCYLNLAASFAEFAADDEMIDRLTLYAFVNTLCTLESVSSVRFLSEGEPMTHYGAVALIAPLQSDTSLIK
ncbi:MAG: GerMN domain-containing protein, partial [Evtepia sp.]